MTPESPTQLWKDPETGMDLPLKTQAYLEEEFEPLTVNNYRKKRIIAFKNQKQILIKRFNFQYIRRTAHPYKVFPNLRIPCYF